MESIKELREKLQGDKVHPNGWKRPFGYKLLQRGPSIYITRVLLPTSIRPNHITAVGILFGLVGCLFLLGLAWYFKLLGLFFLYLNILSDKVDGEIARYKNNYSLKGILWDELNHLIIPPLFWLTLTIGILKTPVFERNTLIIAAVTGALAFMINRIIHSLAHQIYSKKYVKNREIFKLDTASPDKIEKLRGRLAKSWLHYIIRAIHQFQDFFVIISAAGLVLVAERIFRTDYKLHPLVAYFIIIISILLVIFTLENIIKKTVSIEKEVRELASR